MLEQKEIVIAAIFAGALFIILLAGQAFVSRQKRLKRVARESYVNETYQNLGFSNELVTAGELEGEMPPAARSLEQVLAAVGVDVEEEINADRKRLLTAGIYSRSAPIYLIAYKRFFGRFIALVGGLFLLKATLGMIVVGLVLLVLGLFGANIYITNLIQKRQQALSKSFPDGLDLLLVCTEAGLSLDAAMNKLCEELGHAFPEMAKEFDQTRLELALLNNRQQALVNLAERTDLVSYRSLVSALIQAERFGTNLSGTLRTLADDSRAERLLQAEEKANRLPALITVPLILFILPAILLVIFGPSYIQVMQQGGLFGGVGQ